MASNLQLKFTSTLDMQEVGIADTIRAQQQITALAGHNVSDEDIV